MPSFKESAGRRSGRFLGVAFSVAVAAAAVFAFSPRAIPEFPATGLRADTVLLLAAARAGERIVAAGERGSIFLSDDEGASWRAAKSPTEATLTAVRFADARVGWAVGHDAVIMRTEDAGATWQVTHAAPREEKPLLDVYFRDAAHGFAVGAYGLYLETADGGRTWAARAVTEDDRHLNAVAASRDRLYIAGEAGALLASRDGGKTWSRIESPYQGSFFGILGTGDGHLLAFGLRGNVYRSTDPEQGWRRIDGTGASSLMGGSAAPPADVALVGQDAMVLTSRDGGATFAVRRNPGGAALSSALHAGDGGLLVFGERGASLIPRVFAP